MTTATLDSRVKGKIVLECVSGDCGHDRNHGKVLQVPQEIYEKIEQDAAMKRINGAYRSEYLGRQYAGFFVSQIGGIFCSSACCSNYTQS